MKIYQSNCQDNKPPLDTYNNLFDGQDYQNWQSMEDEEERENIIFGKMPSQEEINQMLEMRVVVYQRQKNNPLDQLGPSKPPTKGIRVARPILSFNNAKVLVPIIELAKILSVKNQIKEVLGLEPASQATRLVNESEDASIILQTMHKKSNQSKEPTIFHIIYSGRLVLTQSTIVCQTPKPQPM